VGQRTIQQHESLGTAVIAYSIESILDMVGEPARQGLLLAFQNVHHEFARSHNDLVQVGLVVNAD
jgi:hypothetical protein